MNQILILIIGAVVGGMVVWLLIKHRMSSQGEKEKKVGLIERQAEGKRRNKEAIYGILETQSPLTDSTCHQLYDKIIVWT